MRPPLSFIPLFPLLLSFIIGMILARCGLTVYWAILPVISSSLLLWRGKNSMAIILASLSLGWINAGLRMPQPLDSSITGVEKSFTATVLSINESETSRHLTVEIDRLGKCRLSLPTMFPVINPGDIVTFSAELETPQNRHELPDEWDMEGFMHDRGIIATAYLEPEKISVTGRDSGIFWSIRRMQSHITALLGQSSLSDPATAFLIAAITGDDSLLSPETRQEYTTSGLAHILALSGLHVGIVALLITIILFPLHISGYRRGRLVLTIALLWVYAIMTGLSPSVTRAVIMTTLFLTGMILQRRHSSLNALCFAALVILLASPLSLYSIGFQLSFVAVASLLLFTRRLNPVSPRHRIAWYLMSMVSVSVSAMIGTGFVAAYYFHNFPVYFLIGNILVTLLLPLLIGGGVLLVIFEAFGYEPHWLCLCLDFFHHIITAIVRFSNSLPIAGITGIYFQAWLLIPYFATVSALLASLVFRRTAWYIATLLLAASTVGLFILSRQPFPRQEYFIPRDTYYTNILARDSTAMYLFTTAHPGEHAAVLDQAGTRYRDYMGRRNVDSITLVTDTFDSPYVTRRGRNLSIGKHRFTVLDNDTDTLPTGIHTHYALVCRGFRGDIISVSRTISPDTILISNDMHPARCRRYCLQCSISGIPYRSLRK